jgi:NAD+ synthase
MDIAELTEGLTINTDLARRILVAFIREEVTKVGFERAVVGVSGGIDSSVTCFLTAGALGPENVLALRMPYRASSPDSLEHAQLVVDRLGVQADTVDITPMVEPLFGRFTDMDDRRRGNVMARMRMIVLYDQSVAFNGLVIGSGNKTEALLGYATLYGDAAAAMHPLGDLYKTQVRQLARKLGVPDVIIDKPPTADLWPDQTDEGELGFTYEQADRLLYLLVDRYYESGEAVEAGFEPEFVERVSRLVRDSHYKRVPPLVPKLSGRTLGHNFSYLRDWGR